MSFGKTNCISWSVLDMYDIKWRRNIDKIKRDQKPRFHPLEVGSTVLARNLNERGGPSKTRTFWEQKV